MRRTSYKSQQRNRTPRVLNSATLLRLWTTILRIYREDHKLTRREAVLNMARTLSILKKSMTALMTARLCFRDSKVKEKPSLMISVCSARSEKVPLERSI